MKKLRYFSAASHECCGSTEMCVHNSQELCGRCSCCTFQLLSGKRRGKNVHLHIKSLKWEWAGNRYRSFTYTYHSLDTILQLGSFSWEKSLLLLGFLPWNTVFLSLPVRLPVSEDKGLVQAAAGSVAQDFWAQSRQHKSAWTVFSLTELHTNYESHINCVLYWRETDEWLTRSNHRALSRNIHSHVLF